MCFERLRYLPQVAFLLFLTACSVQEHYRTLSFFFDGIPNQAGENQTLDTDSLTGGSLDSLTIKEQIAISQSYIHQPYIEKLCSSCHNKDRMGSMNKSQHGLCYECHINFNYKYNSEHGPVAGGYCTECHSPHSSKYENLTLDIGEDLCLGCHSETKVSESVFHNISKDTTCLSCHNPHGSNNHNLLQYGTCYKCHDDFSEEYSVLHGPVSTGQCSVCHTSHGKGTENLLKKSGRELCFNCHDIKRLLEEDSHSYIDDTNCIECHNAHGGEDRLLFY